MDTLKKEELKGKIQKVVKESLSSEDLLVLEELENAEGGAPGWCITGQCNSQAEIHCYTDA